MRLVYHQDWRGNFGDDLNPSVFAALYPQYQEVLPNVDLYGIGTLLGAQAEPIRNAVIFGSGFGHASSVAVDPSSTQILGVRGPITAGQLGLRSEFIIGDPALFLPRLNGIKVGRDLAGGRTVVALHHRTSELWNFSAVSSEQFFFLDPGLVGVEDYLATIKSARVVLAEAMHAAIVAVAYEIPFVAFSIRKPLHVPKWRDFMASIDLEFHAAPAAARPATPLLRRLALSRLGHLPPFQALERSRFGVPLSSSYLSRLSVDLRNFLKHEQYSPSRRAVDRLWERFKVAQDKLRELR